MRDRHIRRGLWLAVVACLLLTVAGADAQIFKGPPAGSVYRDYGYYIASNQGRVTTPEAAANYPSRVYDPVTNPYGDIILPNPTLEFGGIQTANATRAEMIITLWGGHTGTTPKWIMFNGERVDVPELQTTPTQGPCYQSYYNVTVDLPMSKLYGTNYAQGDAGSQICWGFGWPQWLWYGVIIRVYYTPSAVTHPDGQITSPSGSSTFGDNPTVNVTTSGTATDRVDVLAYYDGYDTDGDGVYSEYHHDYHFVDDPQGPQIRNHVGTATGSGPSYQVNWNTQWVPDQAAGSVKLIARIRGTNGYWYVTQPRENLTLYRAGSSVRIGKALDTPEHFWARDETEVTCHVSIPTTSDATDALFLVRTWNGADGQAPSPGPYTRVNSWYAPSYGTDHTYKFDILSLPTGALTTGSNTIGFYSPSRDVHGVEIMWPGPALTVRYGSVPTNVPPTITSHPSNQSVAEGQTATFSVGATGTAPLSYQWQKNNVDIGGAIGTSYTTPATTSGDNGTTFRCVVANSYGTATSNPATLTVGSTSSPLITTHPVDQTVSVGQTATFSVVATGSGTLTYQWQKNSVDIGGATSSTYTTPAVTLPDNGALFRCVVTNTSGSTTSNTAQLIVTGGGGALSVAQNPLDQIVGVGQTATFSVVATGSGTLTYQWQKNGADITGATDPAYTTPATALSDSGALFRCVVSNTGGNVTSNTAMLKVTTGSVSILPNSGFEGGTSPWIFYTNGAGSFSVVASGSNYPHSARIAISTEGSNVQLYQPGIVLESGAKYVLFFRGYSTTGHDVSVTLQKHTSPYTSYGLSSQLFDLTTSWRDYSVQFTAGGFSGVVSDGRLMIWLAPYDASGDEFYIDDVVLAKVSSVAPPAIVTHPLSASVNLGQTATFTVAAGGTPPFTYQWQKTGVDVLDANGPSHTTPPAAGGDNGTTYLCVVNNPVGTVSSNSATLTVITTDVRELGGVPTAYALQQNYPNPFNPATEIRYAVPREGHVVLEVYSIVGEMVATLVNQNQAAGYYTVRFDAQRLPSGIYLYRLKTEGASIVKKMALTK